MTNHFGLWRSGTMSVTITPPKTWMPPPPTPCTHRPTSSTSMELAAQQRIVPTVNRTSDVVSQIGRPKMSLSEAMIGMTTAFTSRYEVPTQKARVMSPLRLVTIARWLWDSDSPEIFFFFSFQFRWFLGRGCRSFQRAADSHSGIS